MKILLKFLFFFYISTNLGFSQITISRDKAFHGAIKYLIETQIDSTIHGVEYAGEWQGFMELTKPFFFIGRSQKAQDSNCFSTSAIHNFLAEIYLRDTSLTALRPVLQKSYSDIKTYSTGKEYNFWRAFVPKRKLKLGFIPDPIPLLRRPSNFKIKPRLIEKMANIANDADDTNQANLASWYQNQIFNDSIALATPLLFEQWTDDKRQNRNWYNYLFHSKKNSGAYLTWLEQEYRFGVWTPVHSYISVFMTIIPGSSSNPEAYKPWVPWGANEVDPIVNANVLIYLATTGQFEDTKANQGAIKMIERMVEKQMWSTAGIYYPNTFHLDYSIARAYKAGIHEFQKTAELCLKHMLASQNENGSFESKPWVNNGDFIQSTALALHSLLDLKEKGFEVSNQTLEKATMYLLKNSIINKNGVHWKGGVYFSGGTALRNILTWSSDAYTTALIANSLQRISTL